MRNFTKHCLSVALVCMLGFSTYAQLSKGGTPFSKTHAVQAKSNLPVQELPKPIMSVVNQTDLVNDALNRPYRVGVNTPVNFNVVNSGTWETTVDGGSLWRLKVRMTDAKAISINYHDFFIPTGGKVFLYNENENHVIGAFTSEYNYDNQIRSTQMIEGEVITIEYYAPAGVTQSPIINLSEVVYYYRGIEDFIGTAVSNGVSEKAMNCEVDVACSESTGWQEQVDAVVFYVFTSGGNSYSCSGSMINNTAQDCKPYVLSAWHCGEPNAGSDISSWMWYWNYQKASCDTGADNANDPAPGTQTMSGGTVVASSGNGTLDNPPVTNGVAGSDFYLVELNSTPPASYNAFYAGWDRTENGSTTGVGIHHPAGSAKKISTFTAAAIDGNFNSTGTTHWSVLWAATANGNGVTEGGSSGSPLFNSSGRIIGQLSGGRSACTTNGAGTGTGPTQRDVYGKTFYDWDLCGTANNARLKPWLDPINSGVTVLDGAYEPCNVAAPPVCNINSSATTITEGSSVTFTDGSTASPTSWSWNFDNTSVGGVTPSTSNVQNPSAVTYANAGTYEVELTATNANGSCTSTETIIVTASMGCDTLLNITSTDTLRIYSSANGYVAGWNEFGDVSKAEKYSGYAPYTDVTGMNVYFYGVHDGGSGATVDFNVWNDVAGLPGTIIGTASFPLSTISGAIPTGQGQVNITLPSAVNVGGSDFYIGITMNGFGAQDSLGIVSNSVYDPTANTAYEEWASGGGWIAMEDASAWGVPYSLAISPYVTDAPVSGTPIATPATVCTGSTVDLSFTGSNATGQTWYTGGTPATATTASTTVTYSAPGSYMAYLVLEGACSGQYIDSVLVTVTDGPAMTAVSTDPTCAGNDGEITITATGGTSPYTYSNDGGTTFVSGATFSGLTDGTYNLVVQDANGCESTDVATLAPSSGAITVTSVDTDPSCGNTDGQIVITASGGTPTYTYSIDGGANFVGTSSFSGLAVGSYDIVVSDMNGCQGLLTTSLANTGGPSATATGTNVTCNGVGDGTITISATGGSGTYTYSTDGTTFVAGNTFTGMSAGTYTVYAQDAGSCQTTASVTITEPTAVTHAAVVANASCGASDGSITVTATGGQTPYTYALNSGTPQSSNVFSNLAGNTYNVEAIDANGCMSSMTSHAVTGGTTPSVTTSITGETCMGTNGELVVTTSGGVAPYSYTINGGTAQGSGVFSGLSAGSYAVDVTDANGCAANTTATVTNSGGFTLSVYPVAGQSICAGSSANISASGAGVGASYAWNQSLPLGASHNVSPSTTTTYSVEAVDQAGCTATASVTITVDTPPTVTVIPVNPSICNGESVSLTATGASSYVWNIGSSDPTIVVSPTSQTSYSVVGQNGACNGSSVQVTVGVNPSPTVNAGSDVFNIAVGGTVNFNNAGSNATSYNWNFGDGQSSTTGYVAHTYNVQGTYTAVLTGTIGSCTDSDTLIVNVGVTGVDQISIENSVNVYPNPNTGLFNLKLDFTETQNVEISLFSAIGQLIEMRQLGNVDNQVETFNMSNEAEGVYFIRVKTTNGTVTKRMTMTK